MEGLTSMLQTAAYSQTFSAAQTDVDFPVVSDPSITVTAANHWLPNYPGYIMWVYANALLLQRVRVSTPKVKPISRLLVRPIEQAAAPSSRPQLSEFFRDPPQIRANEEIQILYTTTTAVAERGFVVVTLGDRNMNAPQGDVYTIRATTAFTTVANAWTSGILTLDDVLEAGRYSVIGMEAIQATLEAARLIWPGGQLQQIANVARPGVVGLPNLGAQGTRYFRFGRMGEFGQFESYAPPQLDALNSAAVANPEVYLDIVEVRKGLFGQAA
jgi:hypothetical protein